MSIEKSKAVAKETSPDSLSLPNQNTILININVIILQDMKKNNEIQLRKKWTSIIEN